MDTRSRINDLYEIIAKANSELFELRSACSHENYRIGMYSWRVGAYTPSRLCSVCDLPILGITDAEQKSCWDDWNKRMALYPTVSGTLV